MKLAVEMYIYDSGPVRLPYTVVLVVQGTTGPFKRRNIHIHMLYD